MGDYRLCAIILQGVEAEQQRIAQLLHDTACQDLTATEMAGGLLAKRLQRICPEALPEIQQFRQMLRVAGDSLASCRNAIACPEEVEDLPRALSEWAMRGLPGRPGGYTGITDLAGLPPGTARHLFLLTREAVSAALLAVRLPTFEIDLENDGSKLTLTIAVSALAYPAWAETTPVRTLLNYRAAAVGGKLTVILREPAAVLTCICPSALVGKTSV